MAERLAQTGSNTAAIILAVFAIVCVAAFLSFRGSDVGQLPQLVGNLGSGPFWGSGVEGSIAGIAVAEFIAIAWFGLGAFVAQFVLKTDHRPGLFLIAQYIAIGAGIWSLVWFFLGSLGAYFGLVAIGALVVGWVLAFIKAAQFLSHKKVKTSPKEPESIVNLISRLLIYIAVGLALIASAAPPIAKDTLLYHFALSKGFISQHSDAFVDGNIASYLALGTEMHYVWAMLAGGTLFGTRAFETAAGATGFMFFPILLCAIYGWAREIVVSKTAALIATLVVAAIPSAYHVASSGYVDLSLALYVTLAAYGLTRWWKEQTWGWVVLIGIFLGAALSIKLTTVFVIAAFALIVLLRARETKSSLAATPGSDSSASPSAGRVILTGFAALLLAGVIASPWYVRTWVATGSPVFPFYMNIWPGQANGWDVERSNLFQAMNSQYGGADVNKFNYLTAPARVSIVAQPEQPADYDGVLGPAFLIGLPLLIWALWKVNLGVEIKIMAGVATIMYLFWLFSSQQLRYLLPLVPLLAIAIAASAEAASGKVKTVAKFALIAACICGMLTSFAWFSQKAPLRVVLGGETRDEYLARNLDYYPYYQWLNSDASPDSKVWLINMRRDTYHLDQPVASDYLFEDWTLRGMVWEARNSEELKAKAAATGVQYILTRHDFLFDYDRSSLVDDRRPRAENETRLKMARELLLDPTRAVRSDKKFSLVKLY